MTVRTRITLFITGAGFIASLLFSIIVFLEFVEQPFNLLDTVLKEEAYRTASLVLKSQTEPEPEALDAVAQSMAPYWIRIFEPDSKRMIYQSDLARSVTLPFVKPGHSVNARVRVSSGQIGAASGDKTITTYRIRTFLFTVDGKPVIVQIARAMKQLADEIWELVIGIITGLVFSTLVLIGISRFIAGKILRPIGAMTVLAREISEKNLTRRIPESKDRDEFSELARTINKMLDRLQYSFVKQRNFLFDTSHELKTPLTTMRLAIEDISSVDEKALPADLPDRLTRIKNQILRMDRLVKDLLNLSALEALTHIDPKPVQINDLISSLAEEYQFIASAQNIAITLHLPGPLVTGGDREKLTRAFSNIFDNAVKYNTDGGRIMVTGIQSADELTITIENTGPGVDEKEISKVFDQFYRVDKARSSQYSGSGLGLAIVKRIVELHNGKVEFESRQGARTRVTVSLPVCIDKKSSA